MTKFSIATDPEGRHLADSRSETLQILEVPNWDSPITNPVVAFTSVNE